MTSGRRVLVGVVGAPQGVRGEVRVKSYTADPLALGRYGAVAREEDARGLTIRALRLLKNDMLVVRFEGIDDRDAAAALTHQRLFVERDRLPPPDEEEYYQADLIGLAAATSEGLDLGHVVAVQNFGAGDLLEIVPKTGQSRLVPFTKAFVPVLDFVAGRVIVSPGALGDDDADEPDPEAGL